MTRYLGNKNHKEVHDLYNKKQACQIDEIKPEHKVFFSSLSEAHAAGFDNCAHCIGQSLR